MNTEATITIPTSEYLELLRAKAKLQALESSGVNNWDCYDFAMEKIWGREE